MSYRSLVLTLQHDMGPKHSQLARHIAIEGIEHEYLRRVLKTTQSSPSSWLELHLAIYSFKGGGICRRYISQLLSMLF